MLTYIHIRDFAIITDLALELQAGMTALTGETGAGKSILLDAIGLVLAIKRMRVVFGMEQKKPK